MARSRPRALLGLVLFGALVATAVVSGSGCSGDDGGGSDARIDAISASCMEAVNHSDLTWIQDRIFTPSCADFRACHMGTAPDAGGLSLERGQVRPQTIDVDSDLFPQYKIVAPNDPANSYMMIQLGSFPGPLDPDVGNMPYNSPLLCKEKRDAIERWILAGAPDET